MTTMSLLGVKPPVKETRSLMVGVEMKAYLMMPKKIQPLVGVYFELLAQRKLSAAGKALNDVRQGVHSNQWLRGYVNALEGMLTASESKDDRYVLINKVDPMKAGRLFRDFLHYSRDELQADFDRGFFSAWADYLRYVGKSQLKIDNFMEEGYSEDEYGP